MAYKVKYRLDYCNKEKLNARLDFEIKDYTSTTIHNIIGTQDAFSYKVRNEKSDRSGYFRTLEADINIFEDENFNIDNLLTSDETAIRVKFYIEGQLEFVGFIIPDFFEVSIDKPRVISMVASDRIGTLKNQTLPRQTGIQSFRYMLEQSLLKTGLDLPLNSTINFNPIGETGDFLTNTGGLMERLSSDKGASISCYDIIKSILIVSNSFLVQAKGQWHILNKLEYESRPKTKDIEQINVGGRRLINPPSSKVGVMAEFGGQKSYPLNNNFLILDENEQIANWYAYRDFQSYSADGGGLLVVSPRYTTLGEFNYGEAEPIQIESANPKKVEITAGANVTLHLSESLQVMNTAFSLEATNGTDSLYLTSDGTFSDRFELIYQYGKWDADLDDDVTRSPSYTATLEAENVNDWHLIYRIYGNETPSPLGLTSATWNFVNVEVRGFPSDAKGILYKIEQGVNFTNEVELDTTIFGDFITNGVNGYFYDYAKDERNSIYYKINNEWKHKGIKWRSFNNSSPDTLLLHSVRQRAIMFSAPHNIITAVIKGKFSALDIYDVCGVKYVLVEAQYNFYRNETELRIEEVKYDNSVLKTDYIYSYFGGEDTTSISGVSGVSSGGSSGGGGSPCLIKIDDDGNYYVEENFYSLKDVSAFGKDDLGGGDGDGVALTSWIDQITTLTDFNQNTKFIKQSEVVDNLTSNLSNLPLSARQGMILKNFIDNIEVGEGGQVVVDWDSILGKPSTFAPSAHTHIISDVTDLQVALDAKTSKSYVDDGLATKENVFDKNTAFNRNFGTTAGTVSQGNHTHTFASLTSKPTTLAGYGITDGAKSVDVNAHITDKENPHSVTKTQVGLSNVTNHKQATKAEFDTFKNFFDSLFELDGDYIKAKKSLYSTGDLSAFGKDNLGGGGTGGGTDLVSWVDQIMALTDFNVGSNFIKISDVEAKGYATVTQLNDRVKTPVPLNAKFTDTIVDISGKVDKVAGKSLISDSEIARLANVTNQDLTPYATNSRVNAIDTRLVTVESNYTTQSDIDTAIDGIEIGGRNLLINSNIFTTGWSIYGGVQVIRTPEQVVPEWGATDATKIETVGGSSILKFYKQLINPIVDDTRIISIWVKNDSDSNLNINFNGSAVLSGSSPLSLESGFSGRVIYNVRYYNGSFQLQFRATSAEDSLNFTVWRMQVEVGTKATDWTPAPEDQVSNWNQTNVNAFDFIKNKPTKLSQFSNVETDFVNKTYVDNTFATISNFNTHTSNTTLHKTQSDRDAIASFLSMFEMDGDFIKAKKSLYSVGDLSAFGKDNLGGGNGDGVALTSWIDQITTLTDFNQSTNFINIQQVEAKDYATNTRVDGINSRLTSVEGDSVMTVVTSGSGNAITSISKSGTVITATKGDTFSKVGHTHAISDITNLQTELNSKASNTVVNGINSRLTTVESNYTTQSDIDTAIDGIEIGGRNILPKTSSSFKSFERVSGSTIESRIFTEELELGSTYTLSIFLDHTENNVSGGAARIRLKGYHRGSSTTFEFPYGNIIKAGEKGISKTTFTVNTANINEAEIWLMGRDINLLYKNLKLEKGNKATDWTPAPEDQVSNWNQTNVNAFDYIKNKPTKLSQFSNVETDFTSKTYVTTELNKKVDKVTGKSLISDSEISRLSTVVNQTATSIGLGNVTNESKATMFTNPTFTGTTKVTVLELNTNWKFVKIGNNIELQYNGVTKQEMTSEGHIISHGDVTALLDN